MDLARLWEATLEAMRARIGHTDVEIWLRRSLRILGLDVPIREFLRIQVDNRYYADWIKENYEEELQEAVLEASGRRVHI